MKIQILFSACFSLLSLVSASSCGVHKQASKTADTIQRTLFFGGGGGFTGESHGWVVSGQGRLDSLDGDVHPVVELGSIDFELFENLVDEAMQQLPETDTNKPGNIYRYIIVKKGSEMRAATFGPEFKELNTLYDHLYTSVMQHRNPK